MPRHVRWPLAVVTVALIGCGGSDRPAGGDAGELDAAARDAGTRDAGAALDAADPSLGCSLAGGMCGCAGGCNPGYHLAPSPLLDMCPQPCDGCGACSQQCCLPDDAGVPSDAGVRADASVGGACSTRMDCASGQMCIHPCCGGAGPPCLPAPDGGACPAGSTPCGGPGFMGCQTPCTPPPATCEDTLPPGCMLEGSGEVICLCA